MYRDPSEAIIICPRKDHQQPLLSCIRCAKFPCRAISAEQIQALHNSLFTTEEFTGFEYRRAKMYIFKYADGSLKAAPEKFSLEHPELMGDALEVLYVTKVYKKQTKLVAVSKEQRDVIREQNSISVSDTNKSKQRRKRKEAE